MTATLDATQTMTVPPAAVAQASPSEPAKGFSFHDLWETINPLQHIPIIAPIYRELTGDTITPAARIAGDSLYGGMFGAIGGIVDSLVEGETGKDIGGHIMATVFGDDDGDAKAVAASGATPAVAEESASASSTMPTSLLPPDLSGAAPPSVASTTATATVNSADHKPTTLQQAGPTPFFATLQKGGHSNHGKPLTTSVPLPDSRPAVSIPNMTKPSTDPQSPAQASTPGANPAFVNPLTDTTNSNDMGPLTSNQINPALASGSASGMPSQMMKALDQYAKMQKQQTTTAIGQTDMIVN